MGDQTKSKLSNYYLVKANQRAQSYNLLNMEVNAFYNQTKGSNRDLFQFKNVLEHRIQTSYQKVKTKPQYLSLFLPFVFAVGNIPPEIVILLAAVQMKGDSDKLDVKGTKQMPADTLLGQAFDCIYQSISFGSPNLAFAQSQAASQQQNIKGVIDAVTNTISTFTTGIATAASYVTSGISSLWKSKTAKNAQQVGDLYEVLRFGSQTKTQKKKGSDLIAQYMKSLKTYGQVIIDYDFLVNYALRTAAFGRMAYYIPGVDALLFTIESGNPKVYLKSQTEIKLISESQFTYDFLANVVRAIIARENSDVISEFNNNVSLKKSEITNRQVFKDRIGQGFYTNKTIIKANTTADQKNIKLAIKEMLAELATGSSKDVEATVEKQ